MIGGRGHVQREIIGILTKMRGCSVKELVEWMYVTKEVRPTQSQINGVYSSVRSLARQKIIKLAPELSYQGDPVWVTTAPLRKQMKRPPKRRLSVVKPAPQP